MQMLVVLADGTPLQALKVQRNTDLAELRWKVNQNSYTQKRIELCQLFISNGKQIPKDQEGKTKIEDIIGEDEMEIHVNSELNSVNILINEQKHTKKVPLGFALSSLRNLDPAMFPLHLSFMKKDKVIRPTDESKIKISDILINGTIHLKEVRDAKEHQFEKEQEKQIEKPKRGKIKQNKETKIEKQMEAKEVKEFNILIDRQRNVKVEFNINSTLKELRASSDQIKEQMDFAWRNAPIYEVDEDQIQVKDILDYPFMSAQAVINKKLDDKQKDTVNVLWIDSKMRKEDAKGNIEINKSLSAYLNLESININTIPDNTILDPDKNPADSIYDLGKDGAFKEFKILIGCFHAYLLDDIEYKTAKKALEGKGFEVKVVQTEIDFIKYANNYNQLWVISDNVQQTRVLHFLRVIKDHLKQRKGLLIWADNDPFYVQANAILKELDFNDGIEQKLKDNGTKIQLKGNNYGTQMLNRVNQAKPNVKSFIPHQITTGIFHMNEGVTICYPINMKTNNSNDLGEVKVIGIGSAGVPSYMAIEGNEQRGRIIIDCGFTKLMPNWWNGNWRYVRNCAVWLLWLENIIK